MNTEKTSLENENQPSCLGAVRCNASHKFYIMNLDNYMSNQENLPDFIKDFHDQKDLFKAIYAQYSEGNNKELLSRVNWVDAHCFTIDVFLWWMGKHGYKLQKSKKKV